jgi:Flp pilus assembly pilin Flp
MVELQLVSANIISLHMRALDWVSEHIRSDESGQSVVEYGLLAGVLSIASVAVALLIGPYLNQMYTAILHAWQST